MRTERDFPKNALPVNGRLWAKLLHHGFTSKATVVRLPWEKLKKTAHTCAYKRFFSVFLSIYGYTADLDYK